MCKGANHTFRGTDVLPLLKSRCAQWGEFLAATEQLYIHPIDPTRQQLEGYLAQLLDWMDWVDEETGLGIYMNSAESA